MCFTEEPANIYSLLMVARYLKAESKTLMPDGTYLCEVAIPNKEIAVVYKSEILSHLLQIGAITGTTANKIAESLYANNLDKLQAAIKEYLDKSVSFYDGGTEGFYHGMMLGLIALMEGDNKIKSNCEAGYRFFWKESKDTLTPFLGVNGVAFIPNWSGKSVWCYFSRYF